MAYVVSTPTYVGIVVEATEGTAESTGFVWLPCRAGTNLNHEYENTILDHFNTNSAGVQIDAVQTGVTVSGTVEVFANYVGIGYWLRALFGTSATTGSFVHTFSFGNANTSQPSYTIVTQDSAGVRRFYAGCKVTEATFNMDGTGQGQNSVGRWSFSIIGARKTSETTGNAAPTLPTGLSGNNPKSSHVTTISWNSVNFATAFKKISVKFNRNLMAYMAFGQLYAAKVLPNGYTTIEATVEGALDHTSRTLQTGHDAMSSYDLTITIANSALTHSFVLENAILTKYNDNIGNASGLVMASASFQARADGNGTGTGGCSLALANTNSDYFA